jgi:hypothetical protein
MDAGAVAMIPLNNRHACDECGARASTEITIGFFLCARCAGISENSATSDFSFPDVNAPIVAESTAVSLTVGATNSNPVQHSLPWPPVPETCAPVTDVPAGASFSSVDPGAAGFDFDACISSLENEWLRNGVFTVPHIREARTLRVVARNEIAAAKSKSSVSSGA